VVGAPGVDVRARLSRATAAEILWTMPRLHRTKTASSAPTPSTVRRRFRRGGPEAGAVVVADGTLTELPPTAPPPQAATATTEIGRRPAPSGREMLLVDLGSGLLVLNEARCRMVERMFGVRRDQVNIATVVACLVAAEAAHRRTERFKPSRRPKLADVAIGAGVVRESIYGVAGPSASDTPLAGTLIVLAVLGGLVRQPLVRSAHGMKASSRRLHQAFLGRYGQIVGQRRGAS